MIFICHHTLQKAHIHSLIFHAGGLFDLCAGIKKESFGTVILDLLKYLKSDPGLIKNC